MLAGLVAAVAVVGAVGLLLVPTEEEAPPAVDVAGCSLDPAAGAAAPPGLRVVGFTRTEGFRHPSIEQARQLLGWAAASAGWTLTLTEDPAEVAAALAPAATPGGRRADVLILANTTGDVFDDEQQRVVEAWVRDGGGVVGVHAASDTEYGWPFYGQVIGAWSAGHPPGLQEVDLVVEDGDHPATGHLPERFRWLDEYYDLAGDPRHGAEGDVGGATGEVLIGLDEATATYDPGARPFAMGADHPVAWTRRIDRGRSFVTNLGHRPETWCDPRFQQHLLGGTAWVAGA